MCQELNPIGTALVVRGCGGGVGCDDVFFFVDNELQLSVCPQFRGASVGRLVAWDVAFTRQLIHPCRWSPECIIDKVGEG